MKLENLKNEDIKLIQDAILESSVNIIATCQECKSVMSIEAYNKDMEKANKLIYLANVLNDSSEYSEMKFYEFKDFGYYALIGATTEEEAIKHYEEVVGEIDEDDREPIEINKERAKEKLLNVYKDNKKHAAIDEFTKCIYQDEPYLILMDRSLI